MKEAFYGSFKDFVFQSAVNFLKNRKALPKEEYKKLDDEAKSRAFTVSGYTAVEIIQEFSDELEEAVKSGETMKSFRNKMNEILSGMGYKEMNPWRSDTIFRTNIQTAYNAGHYASMTDPTVMKLQPYWQLMTAGDKDVRAEHAIMHGMVFRVDDPIWDVWYPPNGYRCRCTVRCLSRSQMERMGLTLGQMPLVLNKETGELTMPMPDKGFASNPAKNTYKPDLSKIDRPLRDVFREKQIQR